MRQSVHPGLYAHRAPASSSPPIVKRVVVSFPSIKGSEEEREREKHKKKLTDGKTRVVFRPAKFGAYSELFAGLGRCPGTLRRRSRAKSTAARGHRGASGSGASRRRRRTLPRLDFLQLREVCLLSCVVMPSASPSRFKISVEMEYIKDVDNSTLQVIISMLRRQ